MSARVLLIDTVYAEYIRWLYSARPELATLPYADQMKAVQDTCYHNVSVWGDPLRQLGYEVHDIWAGHLPLHFAWARESGRSDLIAEFADLPLDKALAEVPKRKHWFMQLVIEQAKAIKPDIVWLSNLYTFDDAFLRAIDGSYRFAVGQNAAMPPETSMSRLKFAVSASKFNVQHFRNKGLRAELLPHGFNPKILRNIPSEAPAPVHELLFTGNFYPAHSERKSAMLKLIQKIPVSIYTDAKMPPEIANAGASIKKALWGVEMYREVQKAKATFNIHLDSTGDWATNQRLYEVTGVGSLLVTDLKSNLPDLFDINDEIVAYESIDDCVEKVRYILDHPIEREQIAERGRRRTLTEHTVYHRGLMIHDYLTRYVLH